jgi:hypothetical protein
MAIYDPTASFVSPVGARRGKKDEKKRLFSLPMAMEATSFERNSMGERGG